MKVSPLFSTSPRLRIVRELESDGRAAALQRTPAFVELAAVELEGYLSFRCVADAALCAHCGISVAC